MGTLQIPNLDCFADTSLRMGDSDDLSSFLTLTVSMEMDYICRPSSLVWDSQHLDFVGACLRLTAVVDFYGWGLNCKYESCKKARSPIAQ